MDDRLDKPRVIPFNRPKGARAVDALSEILASFGVAGTIFSQARFGTPWSVHTDPLPSGIFHVIVSGQAHVQLDGAGESTPLATGDIVLMPHGDGHVMASDPKADPIPIASIAQRVPECSIAKVDYPGRMGGDGKGQCSILCGTIRFADELGHPLVQLLPRLIHMRASSLGLAGWIDTTIRMLDTEVAQAMAGSEVMITKLAEMLFVQVLRSYIADLDEHEAPAGWIAGLKDSRIGKALALIHQQPQERWTASSLAAGVGMSRSSFFARFSELVGEPPTQYLTHWRMHLAKHQLRQGEYSLAEIADHVGYASEAAFSKAFKRTVGRSPSEYRMAQRPAVAVG